MWGRTVDAGKHWETLKNPTCPYISPFFLNANLGWGVSDTSICATKDGGKTWAVVQPLNAAGGSGLIFMLDNTHGWVGWGRQILATADGSHWSTQYQDPTMSILEIHFFNTNDGYVRIGSTGHGSTIIYSKDGGQHWDRTDWNVPGVAGLPSALVTCVAKGKEDVWTAAYFVKTDSAKKRGLLAQYDFILLHSRNGGASFENAGKLPDNIGSPKAIAAATQQGKPVLLILDSKGGCGEPFCHK